VEVGISSDSQESRNATEGTQTKISLWDPQKPGQTPPPPPRSSTDREGRLPAIRMMEDNHLMEDCVDLPGGGGGEEADARDAEQQRWKGS